MTPENLEQKVGRDTLKFALTNDGRDWYLGIFGVTLGVYLVVHGSYQKDYGEILAGTLNALAGSYLMYHKFKGSGI